jgi:two-component system response regulator YesN
MYKIMLVEDEPIVRLAIKSLINWEEKGFYIEYEASNGKQALKLLEENPNIDIIVTDINMPIMDGLEFIFEVVKRKSETEIIVLSSYNDYDWVRKSFKFGVNDYILKTEMEPEGILDIVKSVASKIEKRKNSLINRKDGYRGELDLRFQKDIFLRELLENGSIESFYEKNSEKPLKLYRNCIAICYLWIDDYQTIKDRYVNNSLKAFTQSVINSIDQVLNDTNTGEVLCQSPEEFILFMAFDETSQKQVRNKLVEIVGRIQYSLKNYVNISVSVGISDIRSNNEKIGNLFEQAKQNVKLRFIVGKGKMIFPETVNTIMWRNNENSIKNNHRKESIIGKEADFLRELGTVEEVKTFFELEKLFAVIRLNNSNKIEKLYSGYMELIFVTISYLSKIGKETEAVFGTEIDFYEKILRFETQDEIENWIKNMISWILNYLKECKTSKPNRLIANAKHFIQMNYANSGLSLKMVSEFVELSESHFSTTFTKEVGETFTDYLTRLRLDKAKELIANTNLKLYEICERVGYTNAEHFSRIFKKVVGCSPKDYKKTDLPNEISNNQKINH